MEQNKKYGVIDPFTVLYCTISFLVVLAILAGIGGISVEWWGFILLGSAPFIIDWILTVVITVYATFRKIVLRFKKWRHEKKNPAIKF